MASNTLVYELIQPELMSCLSCTLCLMLINKCYNAKISVKLGHTALIVIFDSVDMQLRYILQKTHSS